MGVNKIELGIKRDPMGSENVKKRANPGDVVGIIVFMKK